MTLVSNYPDLLQKLFVEVDDKEGRYTVRLYYEHEWKLVTIDDRIPCGEDGFPVFGHNTLKHEIWVCILEKAMAKLLGSYEALDGGWFEEGVVMLTGGRPEKLFLDEWIGSKQLWRPESLWDKLMLYNSERIMMGCAISGANGELPKEAEGLVEGHAYGILDVKETSDKKHKLLKIRNPWGKFEWTGAWSDDSRSWTPQYRSELGCEDSEDGVFWMEFRDFCSYFSEITCCRILNDSIFTLPSKFKTKTLLFPSAQWNRKKIEGTWSDSTAGGCLNHKGYSRNPHLRLVVRKPSRFFFIIYRPYIQQDVNAEYYRSSIGFTVYRGTDNNYKLLPNEKSNNVAFIYPMPTRFNAIELTLEVGDYVITPCTQYPNRKSNFVFEVYAPIDFDIVQMEPDEVGKNSVQVVQSSSTAKFRPVLNMQAKKATDQTFVFGKGSTDTPVWMASLGNPNQARPEVGNSSYQQEFKKKNTSFYY